MRDAGGSISFPEKELIALILGFDALLFVIGITWGLPNTESWLSDSLAPFHPLLGLAKGFSFGYFNKYPLVHQVILAICNIPVLVAALVASDPLDGFRFLNFLVVIRSTGYATALLLIDNLVSVAMGVGTVYVVYLSARELFGRRAGVFAAFVASFNMALNFYSHVAKVEVPSLFWMMLSLHALVRIVKYDRTNDYLRSALFACLAFGTKDQIYAVFIIPMVLFLLAGKPVSAWFRKNLLVFAGTFVAGCIVVENLLFNMQGFLRRLAFLTGDGGERSAGYGWDPAGIIALFFNSLYKLMQSMSPPLFFLSLAGIVLLFRRYRGRDLLLRSLFLLAGLSYYLFFLQVIRQDNERFLLPFGLFLSIYGGFALAYLRARCSRSLATFALPLALVAFYSFYNTFSVNMTMLHDTRYAVEKWMNAAIPRGATIEYYSYLHYLPRFPAYATAYRVKKRALEVGKRRPDYIVLTSHYYPRFLQTDAALPWGRKRSLRVARETASEFSRYFPLLLAGKLGYCLEKRFDHRLPFFRTVRFSRISPDHVLIFRRTGSAVPAERNAQ